MVDATRLCLSPVGRWAAVECEPPASRRSPFGGDDVTTAAAEAEVSPLRVNEDAPSGCGLSDPDLDPRSDVPVDGPSGSTRSSISGSLAATKRRRHVKAISRCTQESLDLLPHLMSMHAAGVSAPGLLNTKQLPRGMCVLLPGE